MNVLLTAARMVFQSNRPPLIINRMTPHAVTPHRANESAVGFDVYISEGVTCEAGKTIVMRTGIRALPPSGAYLRLNGRSGLTSRGLLVQPGVVDPDYSGEIQIVMFNSTSENVFLPRYSRVAQLIPELYVQNCDVAEVDMLSFSCAAAALGGRGEMGFGSSGI